MTIDEYKEKCKQIIDKVNSEKRAISEDELTEIGEIKAKIQELRNKEGEKPVEKRNIPTKDDEPVDEPTKDEEVPTEKKDEPTEGDEPTKDEEPKDDSIEKNKKENNQRNLTKKMSNKKEFRLLKTVRAVANNQKLDDFESSVIEAGNAEMRAAGVNAGGQIVIPVGEVRSAVQATVEGQGNEVIATDIYDIMTPLRSKNVLAQAGAKFMTGLSSNVKVPIMGASNVGWSGEIDAAKDGGNGFEAVTLSPKRLTAYLDISKQFLAQDSKDAESLIRQDLIAAINSKLEATILGNGAGDLNTPSGFFATAPSAVTSDFKGLCDVEASIEDANIVGSPCYVMSNKAKAVFRTMNKSSKTTQLVFENGEIDGTKVYNTSNVAGNGFIYGDFSNYAIAQWGAIDLTVDPFTRAAYGEIRLVINTYFDAKPLRPEAFVIGKNA